MLARALWLQACAQAFRDEVFGTVLQKRRQWCQRSKNLITLAGTVVVGFSCTQQNMKKKTSKILWRLTSRLDEISLPHVNPHTVMEM